MIVRYYKDGNLSYSGRKRFLSFNYEPFFEEEQKAILLGDGANTSVKTSKDNICDYVTIDDTRWFVTSYTYMNGGQVTLNLQRDVIGEFGVQDCAGKIERGYTESFIRNRKELDLNQILKNRKYLIPNDSSYGNFSVDNHNNEMWGILYFVRPTGNDPTTGEPYPKEVNINIPAFAPEYISSSKYPVIEDGSTTWSPYFTNLVYQDIYFKATINIPKPNAPSYKNYYRASINYKYDRETNSWSGEYTIYTGISNDEEQDVGLTFVTQSVENGTDAIFNGMCNGFCEYVISQTINNNTGGITFPSVNNLPYIKDNYDGLTIKDTDGKFYSYSSSQTVSIISGSTVSNATLGTNSGGIGSFNFTINSSQETCNLSLYKQTFSRRSEFQYYKKTYKRTELTGEDAGDIIISTEQNLVDEPFNILIFPLYDVKIKNIENEEEFIVNKAKAFNIFNTVIQYLSGENPYLVDAQIFPYCPELVAVQSQLQNYPFFSVQSTSFTRDCPIQLLANKDVKKEYIQKQYSIVSPDQNGKFTFNFYDYVNEFVSGPDSNLNYSELTITVKVALKPFSIICSAVINPKDNSLIGMTYESDLRGCVTSANGFEASLSSDQFQQYKRQNSNYQQIFELQKDELSIQHQTERVNEKVSATVNTITATAMGAIGGKALTDSIIPGTGNAGAALGAGIAGGTVLAANAIQYSQNEKLREFETNLQQQNFDLAIGTIKNLPNSVNRVSSFNEIIMKDFWFVVETYECSEFEKTVVDNYIRNYSYSIGVISNIKDFCKNGWFIRSTLIKSNFVPNLHNIASKELMGGIYIYD